MLNKTNEVYDSGKLVAELFRGNHALSALFIKEGIAFRNTHYLRRYRGGQRTIDYLLLAEPDFAFLSKAVCEWRKTRASLWGRISHGHSWCGYLGTEYFAPNSKDGVFIKKGNSAAHLNVGKAEERMALGGLDFVLKRFKLEVIRGKHEVAFNEHQVLLVYEAFNLYSSRKGNYSPKSIDKIISSLGYGDF